MIKLRCEIEKELSKVTQIRYCHVLTEYLRTHQDNMADHNKHILFKTNVRM